MSQSPACERSQRDSARRMAVIYSNVLVLCHRPRIHNTATVVTSPRSHTTRPPENPMDPLDEAGFARVRQWIGEMKAGDDEAVKRLMEQYLEKLQRMARCCLDGVPRGARDETDI